MFKKGDPKPAGSGKKKGAKNKRTVELQEKAKELGINPFEVLLLFADNRWEDLGYANETITKYSASGDSYEEYVIDPSTRVVAAKEACKYLYPQLKAIDHTSNGESLGQSLTDVLKSLANDKRGK